MSRSWLFLLSCWTPSTTTNGFSVLYAFVCPPVIFPLSDLHAWNHLSCQCLFTCMWPSPQVLSCQPVLVSWCGVAMSYWTRLGHLETHPGHQGRALSLSCFSEMSNWSFDPCALVPILPLTWSPVLVVLSSVLLRSPWGLFWYHNGALLPQILSLVVRALLKILPLMQAVCCYRDSHSCC